MIKGHKYFRSANINVENTTSVTFNIGGVFPISTASQTGFQTLSGIFQWTYSTGNQSVRITDNRTSNWTDVYIKNVVVIDLTQMFGSTIADYIYSLEQANTGAGVAWFRKLFPNSYYEYNTGELLSVNAVGKETTGKNQAFSYIPYALGTYNNGYVLLSGTAGSSLLFKCIEGQKYIFSTTGTTNRSIWAFFDEYPTAGSATTGSWTDKAFSGTYTVESPITGYGLFYIKNSADESLYGNSQIELGTTATAYEPYTQHIYPLADVELRGIPKLDENNSLYYDGDTYEPNGTVTRRYGIVDLGTLNWAYDVSQTEPRFVSTQLPSLAGGSAYWCTNAICSNGYRVTENIGQMSVQDKAIGAVVNSTSVYAEDDSYTDAATFKAAMSSVMFVYELATTTTEDADPYESPQVVYPFGTEEYVTSSIVPVGHETTYLLGDSNVFINPTPFTAKPLIKVRGYGSMTIGDCTAIISGSVDNDIYIDCESMEIYQYINGSLTNASSLVSFSTNDFPVLEAGTTTIRLTGNIVSAYITPRWWRL